MNSSVKVCFAASSGGHFEQIMRLKPLMNKYSSFVLTEKVEYNISVDGKKIYEINQINRKEHGWIIKILINFIKSIRIYKLEKPDVIITTGVLSMIPICIIAHFRNKKVIYIESFAKVTSPTLTGRLIYKFADEFYVQWESMKKIYPKAKYLGGIY